MKTVNFFFLSTAILLAAISCSDDDGKCVNNYEDHVKSIIDNSCAYSGCHSGNDAGQWVPATAKDYTSYEGLLESLNSGKFALRVLEMGNMPPDQFIPQGRPTELTTEEKELIECWAQNGFIKK